MAAKRIPPTPGVPTPVATTPVAPIAAEEKPLFEMPEDWPRNADGHPLDFEEMNEEQRGFVLDNFGCADLESFRANVSTRTRLDSFQEGKPSYTPWHVRDVMKYDATMHRYSSLSGTHLYLAQTAPDQQPLQAPNPQEVPDYASLDLWLRENAWNGHPAKFSFLIRSGSKQIAAGNISYSRNDVQIVRWTKKLEEIKNNLAGGGSSWSFARPAPAPVHAPVAPAPAAAPVPVVPTPNRRDDMERRIEEERKSYEQRLHQLELEKARLAHQMELEKLRLQFESQIKSMESRYQPAQPQPAAPSPFAAEVEEMRRKLAEMEHQSRMAAAPPPAPPAAPAAPSPINDMTKPPPDIELPTGFDWQWDWRVGKWRMVDRRPPQDALAVVPPAPLAPAAPAAQVRGNGELPILQAAKDVAKISQQTQQAAEVLAGALGFQVPPGINPFARPEPAALASETADKKDEEEKEKKDSLFHEEGGLMLRKDKEGQFITDSDQLGVLDFIANGGKIFDMAKLAGEYFSSQRNEKLAEAEREVKIAKERAEAKEREAQAELIAAEARKKNAEALLMSKQALGEQVASQPSRDVSSEEPSS